MDFGYLIIVSDNEEHDYLKMAYSLALSIKNTQREGYNKVALVTNNVEKVKELKSPWIFDIVIEKDLPDGWDGRSYMDLLSPWEYTVCLDADMLFFDDYSHWIDYFVENCELYIPSKSYTYRNELVTSDWYRKCFTKNDLPNLYSFFTFFKRGSSLAKEFFELNRIIIKNPNEFKNMFLEKHRPSVVGTDEAFSLSSKILDISDQISYDLEFPRVVHLKSMVQNWPWPADDVLDHVGFYFNTNAQLKIGNYFQDNIVHYVKKDLMTDEFVSILEEIAWKK